MISLDFNEALVGVLDGGVTGVNAQPQYSTTYGEISFTTKVFSGAKSSEGTLNNTTPVTIIEAPDNNDTTRRDLKSLLVYCGGSPARKLTIKKVNVNTNSEYILFSAIIPQGYSLNYDGSFKVITESGALVTASTTLTNTVIGGFATDIVYDNHATGITGNDVQAAIDGIATRLNNLDATELGYLDGIESNVQDQLDSKVNKNANITASTKTKITYDEKGLVTSGADLSESDIPTLSQSKITNLISDLSDKEPTIASGLSTQFYRGDKTFAAVPWADISGKPSSFTPSTHASSHVTGGSDIIPDAIALGNSGLLSGSDKAKLDGIASGATANSTDAQLRDRTTHTGVQAISTVTGLQTALDSKVDENGPITGGTKTKITYDSKGLVTSGTDATTADIADSTNKRYVTDAEKTLLGNTSGTNTGDQDLSGLQPLDSDLTSIAGLTPTNNDIIQRKLGVWTNRTPAQLKTDLALTKGDVGLGSVVNADTTTTANIVDSTNKRFVTDAEKTVIGNTSGTNTGDNAVNTTSNTYADGKVADSITNGITNVAPSQNAVYDALAGKQDSLGFTPEDVSNKSTSTSLGTSDTLYPSQKAVKTYVDNSISTGALGLLNDRGNFDASVNAYPSSGGSGTAGAILKGNLWTVSVRGTLPTGIVVAAGDVIRALTDSPENTQSNWAVSENNIGYVTENVANKDTDGTLSANSDTKYPSQKAVKTYADTKVTSNGAITGATKTKITYDSKGLVTSGADATTADISDSSNKRYVTDANLTVINNTSGTNTGDNSPNSNANAYADGKVADAITNGITDVAPSQNAVYDALAGKVDTNVAVVGATKTKITYDSKGLVTAGADATTADIADSTNKRYVTDAQQTVISNTSGTNSGDETAARIAAINHGTTSKSLLIDADEITGQDSANSYSLIRTTWTNVKAFLKTYFDSIYVTGNGAITGATKTKITYDSKGLVTSATDATTADIADSSNKRYVTDAQLTVISNTSGTNTGDNAVNSLYSGLATSKQDTLVSGTNIKTINSTSLLGSGDIAINGATNLGLSLSSTQVTITSDTGNDAIISSADASNAGILTSADKTKLDGIASGATANDTDANLKNRANHTGSQSASTISDFSEAVDDRVAALLVAGSNIILNYNDASNTLTITSTGGGGGGTDFDIDKTLTYTGDQLTELSSALGTKTFNYTGDKLTSITGTGAYKSKTFTYSGDLLTSIDVA